MPGTILPDTCTALVLQSALGALVCMSQALLSCCRQCHGASGRPECSAGRQRRHHQWHRQRRYQHWRRQQCHRPDCSPRRDQCDTVIGTAGAGASGLGSWVSSSPCLHSVLQIVVTARGSMWHHTSAFEQSCRKLRNLSDPSDPLQAYIETVAGPQATEVRPKRSDLLMHDICGGITLRGVMAQSPI